jgi:WD40 repeat protein
LTLLLFVLVVPVSGTAQERTDHHGDPLPRGALRRLGTVRFRHEQAIAAGVFTPDGKSVITAGSDAVRLWDLTTGREIRRLLSGLKEPVQALALSPDDKLLALATHRNGKVPLVEVATGKVLREFQTDDSSSFWSVAFTPDSKRLILGDNGRATLRLLDVADGKEVRRWERPENAVYHIAVSPDGKTVAEESYLSIRLWDLETGQLRHRIDHWGNIGFTPDGKTLLIVSRNSNIRYVDPVSGRILRTVPIPWDGCCADSIDISPDGKLLAIASMDHTVRLWDIAAGKEVHRLADVTSYSDHVRRVAFSPDSKTLLTCGAAMRVRLWDVGSGKERDAFGEGHRTAVWSVLFAPDGKTLLTGSETIRVWDVATGREQRRLAGSGAGMTLTREGRTLATLGPRHSITIWDLATGQERHRLTGHKDSVTALAFAPDGHRLASSSHDRTVRWWNPATGKELFQRTAEYHLEGLAWSPDGRMVLAGDRTRTISLWDAAGKPLARFTVNGRDLSSMRLSPDGRTLAYGAYSPRLGLCDLLNRTVRTPAEEPTYAQGMAFSPDGHTLATVHYNGRVIVWETATLQERAQFVSLGPVRSVAFSPDGRTLATGNWDTTTLLWDVTGRQQDGNLVKADLTPAALQVCWEDLTSRDARKAGEAVWALVAAPQSAAFLRARLNLPEPVEPRKVGRLLDQLEDDQLAFRDKAEEELAKLGWVALPALRQALSGKPSPQARQRLQGLVDRIETSLEKSGERRRLLRVIEILEQIGTAPGRGMLQILANTAPELREEARAALGRLR